MRPIHLRVAAIALSIGLVVACDDAAMPTDTPFQAAGSKAFDVITDVGDVQLVELNWPDSAAYVIEQVIGAKGGRLRMGPHELLVYRGAVSTTTRFVMTVTVGKYLIMDLTAFRESDGVQIATFSGDVLLKMSYEDLAWLGDPSRLTVVYLNDGTPDGRKEKVRSEVDRNDRKVGAKLKHFSSYSMGIT